MMRHWWEKPGDPPPPPPPDTFARDVKQIANRLAYGSTRSDIRRSFVERFHPGEPVLSEEDFFLRFVAAEIVLKDSEADTRP